MAKTTGSVVDSDVVSKTDEVRFDLLRKRVLFEKRVAFQRVPFNGAVRVGNIVVGKGVDDELASWLELVMVRFAVGSSGIGSATDDEAGKMLDGRISPAMSVTPPSTAETSTGDGSGTWLEISSVMSTRTSSESAGVGTGGKGCALNDVSMMSGMSAVAESTSLVVAGGKTVWTVIGTPFGSTT